MQQVIILLKGHLAETWADWIEGFEISYPNTEETLLCGKVFDQAALYGLIGKLRDLGFHLKSVQVETIPNE